MIRRPIVGFYSYKGGVGRTFLLANVAVLLAEWGYRTLCVDLDLEAPGLPPYLGVDLPPTAIGVVDLLSELQQRGACRSWRAAVRPVRLYWPPGRSQRAPLDLLPAGYVGREHASRLRGLNWETLFSSKVPPDRSDPSLEIDEHAEGGPDLGGRLERWRREWLETYDVVLIDSRTGLTDIQGITTAQLADLVVLPFTCNRQGLEGTRLVMELTRSQALALPYDRGAPCMIPVPSRFDAAARPRDARARGRPQGRPVQHGARLPRAVRARLPPLDPRRRRHGRSLAPRPPRRRHRRLARPRGGARAHPRQRVRRAGGRGDGAHPRPPAACTPKACASG